MLYLPCKTQVIFILAHSRWDSKDNNKVWLYILFSQTSSKLSLSPSSSVLWASSKSQHPSHFSLPACLLLCSPVTAFLLANPRCAFESKCARVYVWSLQIVCPWPVLLWSSSPPRKPSVLGGWGDITFFKCANEVNTSCKWDHLTAYTFTWQSHVCAINRRCKIAHWFFEFDHKTLSGVVSLSPWKAFSCSETISLPSSPNWL